MLLVLLLLLELRIVSVLADVLLISTDHLGQRSSIGASERVVHPILHSVCDDRAVDLVDPVSDVVVLLEAAAHSSVGEIVGAAVLFLFDRYNLWRKASVVDDLVRADLDVRIVGEDILLVEM